MTTSQTDSRTSPGTSDHVFLQIASSERVDDVPSCPRVLGLVYPSRTRALLPVLKTHNRDMTRPYPPRPEGRKREHDGAFATSKDPRTTGGPLRRVDADSPGL